MTEGMRKIGEVAAEVGLSLRTVRYYEEVGLVTPSGRTEGGFRLYTDDDVAHLAAVKRLKPLDFTLDEMRDLIHVRDRLLTDDLDPTIRAELLERLAGYAQAARRRCLELRDQLACVEAVTTALEEQVRTASSAAVGG